MAKFYGVVGYIINELLRPGVWEEQVTERTYSGDILRSSVQAQASGGVNDNFTLANDISIISDPFANRNFQFIRYVEVSGTKWKIVKVDIRYPRLILTTGGLYTNG